LIFIINLTNSYLLQHISPLLAVEIYHSMIQSYSFITSRKGIFSLVINEYLLTEDYSIMINREELIGTTQSLTL